MLSFLKVNITGTDPVVVEDPKFVNLAYWISPVINWPELIDDVIDIISFSDEEGIVTTLLEISSISLIVKVLRESYLSPCNVINSFISTLAKFYEGYFNIKIIVNNITNNQFNVIPGTPSTKYRPAIDKRFVMPCTYWIRDMDRFKVFRLEYDGLNKLQTLSTIFSVNS